MNLNRRQFLSSAVLLPTAFASLQDGRLVGTVPLGNPGGRAVPPFGRLLGTGLDARLFTDLSALSATDPATLVTASDRFFVRTAAPSALARTDAWTLALGGLVRSPVNLNLRNLEPHSASGRHLIECSGNADQTNFGLMSTADWEGVPLAAALDRVQPSASRYRVLVSGVDDMTSTGGSSVPGASWIFDRGDLDRALLVTRMNGAPLTRDHGSPVRLVVPGWYGCACIKWVDRLDLVADDAPPTAQMREFAARTHQPFDALTAEPLLARDFIPAVIDTAAVPVRVEKWIVNGQVVYRLIGIVWGGAAPTTALAIRFKSSQPWVPVDDCPRPASTLTWSLWSHTWRPESPGRYQIVLKVTDPAIRTRRLDIFFYVREVDIADV